LLWERCNKAMKNKIKARSEVETDESNESCLCLQISPVMTFLGLVSNMNQSLLINESIF
jgi:hypothetical protein